MNEIKRVVVLGANGTMGSGGAALFASRGYEVTMLARSIEKAEQGLAAAKGAVRAESIGDNITVGAYETDLAKALSEADFILEAVAERMDIKKATFEKVDAYRKPGSVVATVSSGLSMDSMIEGRSEDFQRHFMGAHIFNPPHVIVGTEMIAASTTDRELFNSVKKLMVKKLGRVVIECQDKPAFAGNRVGFKVLNECAQLAKEHGVATVDYLVGPYTGRAMPPLKTIDLVGWDVHEAIVSNVYALTEDEAHAAFELPDYMHGLIEKGHLGNKTPGVGGFYASQKHDDGSTTQFVLDPKTSEYNELVKPAKVEFIETMKSLHRMGLYEKAGQVFLDADGPEADLARRVILGYLSYGLNRVGADEVVASALDVDLIMGYGFNWAPPSVLVDLFGRNTTIAALEKYELQVPTVVSELADGAKLFAHRGTNIGRYFINR